VKIKIARNLSRSNDIVTSKITIRPINKIFEDSRRDIYQFLNLLVGYLSLEPQFQLTEYSGNFFDRLFKFKVLDPSLTPEIFKEYSFDYFPNMTRKCKNCIHVRRYNNNKLFCNYKSKKIKGSNWDNCWDWHERSMIVGNEID